MGKPSDLTKGSAHKLIGKSFWFQCSWHLGPKTGGYPMRYRVFGSTSDLCPLMLTAPPPPHKLWLSNLSPDMVRIWGQHCVWLRTTVPEEGEQDCLSANPASMLSTEGVFYLQMNFTILCHPFLEAGIPISTSWVWHKRSINKKWEEC